MGQAGAVIVKLSAENKQFSKTVKQSQNELVGLGKTTVEIRNLVGASFALQGIKLGISGIKEIFSVAESLKGLVNETINANTAAYRLAQTLGLTTDQLQGYQQMADDAGIDTDTFNTGINKLVKNLGEAAKGTGPAAEALEKLGLSGKELANNSVADSFTKIVQKISEIQDPIARSQVAVDLFGKAGQSLLPAFTGGAAGIRQAHDEAVRIGTALSDIDAQKLLGAWQAIDNVGDRLEGIKNQFAVALAPTIEEVANAIINLIPPADQMRAIFLNAVATAREYGETLVHTGEAVAGFVETHQNEIKAIAEVAAGYIALRVAISALTVGYGALSSAALFAANPVTILGTLLGVVAAATIRAATTNDSYTESIYRMGRAVGAYKSINHDIADAQEQSGKDRSNIEDAEAELRAAGSTQQRIDAAIKLNRVLDEQHQHQQAYNDLLKDIANHHSDSAFARSEIEDRQEKQNAAKREAVKKLITDLNLDQAQIKLPSAAGISDELTEESKKTEKAADQIVKSFADLQEQIDDIGLTGSQKKLRDFQRSLGVTDFSLPDSIAIPSGPDYDKKFAALKQYEAALDAFDQKQHGKSAGDELSKLQGELDKLGKTDLEKAVLDWKKLKFTDEDIAKFKAVYEQIDATKQSMKDMDAGKKIFEDSQSAADKYSETLENLNRLLNLPKPAIDQDTFNRASLKARRDLGKEISDDVQRPELIVRRFDFVIPGVMNGTKEDGLDELNDTAQEGLTQDSERNDLLRQLLDKEPVNFELVSI